MSKVRVQDDENQISSLSSPESSSSPADTTEELDGEATTDALTLIKNGSKGLTLVAVLVTSTAMTLVSLSFIVQYEPQSRLTQSTSGFGRDCYIVDTAMPLWMDLLITQVHIIQNLVHASLTGAAAMVAALRGDILWFFASRNGAFYFGLAAYSHIAIDVTTLLNASSDQGWEKAATFHSISLLATEVIMALSCTISFFRFEAVRWDLRTLQAQQEITNKISSSHKRRSTIILNATICSQILAFCFVVAATLAAWHDQETFLGSFRSYESSYTIGAHEGTLTTMFFLASACPTCNICVGAAVLASAWRVIVAFFYLVRFTWAFDESKSLSLLFVLVELSFMTPILVAAIQMHRTNAGKSTTRRREKSVYKVVPGSDDDSEENDPNDAGESEAEHLLGPPRRMSLWYIFQTPCYSTKQRQGAFILWVGTFSMFIGMTVECTVLLIQGYIGTEFTTDVYKWGMHVGAMFVFCNYMVVTSPEVYAIARVLLGIACPSGAAIGAWQLWFMFTENDDWDILSIVASSLFAFRAFCGCIQTFGVIWLVHVKPEVSDPDGKQTSLSQERTRSALNVLWGRYMPLLVLYVSSIALFAGCSQPLLSPSLLPDHKKVGGQDESFTIVPDWPGLDVFFHFGILTVTFAVMGLAGTTYSPSLNIAIVFTGQVLPLIATSIVVELDRALVYGNIPGTTLIQLVLLLAWMVGSVMLEVSLVRVLVSEA